MQKPHGIPAMEIIPVQEAEGTILCHDITMIVPGRCKGPAFRKGHRISGPEDIENLLRLGKEHLYVYKPQPGFLHEEEAAERLALAARGANLLLSSPREGRVTFSAAEFGLLEVNVSLLEKINSLGLISFATLHSFREVSAGEALAGVRVIPLIVEEELILRAEELCAAAPKPLLSVLPYNEHKIGIVITGSEIYHGRIQDAFGPVLRKKFAHLGCPVLGEKLSSDDVELTKNAILSFVAEGADMVAVTGGMSVDPDDRTPSSIRAAGAEIVSYGAPVLPGSMFLLAYLYSSKGKIPVLGLPGCVMHHGVSIFDLVVPRILAGLTVEESDLLGLGHGAFCSGCAECRFPNCAFGK
ncbi:MAG: molybdopterin-binding protein [Deltaproteobacteria bacterium]|jgi:hypothetical protein|nr:molybdopterin-binding protein [Deltaproteobacteria bacterium]